MLLLNLNLQRDVEFLCLSRSDGYARLLVDGKALRLDSYVVGAWRETGELEFALMVGLDRERLPRGICRRDDRCRNDSLGRIGDAAMQRPGRGLRERRNGEAREQ